MNSNESQAEDVWQAPKLVELNLEDTAANVGPGGDLGLLES